MTIKKSRAYSRYTKDAAILLGKHIQLARKNRKLSEHDFADRIGISRTTLHKIEKGDLKCEIGLVFEAATLAGIKLFDVNQSSSFEKNLESVNDKLALIPKSIRNHPKELDDAF